MRDEAPLKAGYIHNHAATPLSKLEADMISHVPQGGNWQSIPSGMSSRVDQIRDRSSKRGVVHTTYYGRLRWDEPSYTISTFFTRSGNGCFIHPQQDRLISAREAARLQTFPDYYSFYGSQRSIAEQIGNAVPPFLAYQVGLSLPGKRVVDLFSGAGGMSLGMKWAQKEVMLAVDCDEAANRSYMEGLGGSEVRTMELGSAASVVELVDAVEGLGGCDIVVGGPPCQSFSTAGLRAADDRSTLVDSFVECVERLGPQGFVMENVLGLRSFQEGRVLERATRRLGKAGYELVLWDLKAEQFGVPQRRRRLFLVGTRDEPVPERPEAVYPPYKKGAGTPAATVADAIGDLPHLGPGDGSPIPEGALEGPTSTVQRLARGVVSPAEALEGLWNGLGPRRNGVHRTIG